MHMLYVIPFVVATFAVVNTATIPVSPRLSQDGGWIHVCTYCIFDIVMVDRSLLHECVPRRDLPLHVYTA